MPLDVFPISLETHLIPYDMVERLNLPQVPLSLKRGPYEVEFG